MCDNDTRAYQACGFETEIKNSDTLCGGYICTEKEAGNKKYIECDNCTLEHMNCSTTADNTVPTVCDDKCDTWSCEDESECNGFRYGVRCSWRGEYLPAGGVCDGEKNCDNGADEENCTVTDSTLYTCTHDDRKYWDNEDIPVPILNHTRCSVFDKRKYISF